MRVNRNTPPAGLGVVPPKSARVKAQTGNWAFPFRLRLYHWLIIAWDVIMISIPIMRWVLGDHVLHWGVLAGVTVQVAAVLAILHLNWGTKRTLAMTLLVLPAAWLIEWIGSSTGFPFGSYSYTNLLQPQLGHVPLIIPLAWLMMLPPAWAIAAVITQGRSRLWFVVISALAFTAWDFFLDPQMVGWGYWVWAEDHTAIGSYFGIPWVNFAGWLASAALLTVLASQVTEMDDLPVQPLILVYAITWILQTIGQLVFWQMPGPALVGFVAMGLFVLLALRAIKPEHAQRI